jgi:hypothetical protein
MGTFKKYAEKLPTACTYFTGFVALCRCMPTRSRPDWLLIGDSNLTCSLNTDK